MSQRRIFDRLDRDAERDAPADAPPVPAGEAARVLALQRSAGNAAVARMLAAPSQSVAREVGGYTVPAPSDAEFDASDSLEGSESEADSADEDLDPGLRLDQALAMKVAETGTIGQRPASDATGYTGAGPGAEDAISTDSESTSESESASSESTSSETSSEDASDSLSEDAPVSDRVLEVAAVVAAEDDAAFSELSADAASELSSDLSSDASESGSAEVSGDEAASSASSSRRSPAAPPATAPAAPSLPAAAAPAVKKSAAKRALKALAKPARALKKIFKGKKRKDLPTAAQLLADDTDAADTTSSSSSSTSASKSTAKPKRARRKSRSEYSDALSTVMSASTSSASASLSTDEESLSEYTPQIPQAPPLPDPNRGGILKYKTRESVIGATEEQDSATWLNEIMSPGNWALIGDMLRFKLIKETGDPPIGDIADIRAALRDPARLRDGLKRVWGWSDEDVTKYFVHPRHQVKDTKVQFIRSEEELEKYVVHAGATMTYGDPPQVFDTANMISKASGVGFAIFVMDDDGNIYAGQHRVGLFHHSSFTAGRPVAAAGELQVSGGKLVQMTAKSGHYRPTAEHTWQVVLRMAALGVSFAGTEIKVWVDVPGKEPETHYYDGAEFLEFGGRATVKRKGGQF